MIELVKRLAVEQDGYFMLGDAGPLRSIGPSPLLISGEFLCEMKIVLFVDSTDLPGGAKESLDAFSDFILPVFKCIEIAKYSDLLVRNLIMSELLPGRPKEGKGK